MHPHNPPADPEVARLMSDIVDKSRLIHKQQEIADTKGFESYGGAIGLQRLRNERRKFQAQLPPLRVVPA